MTGRFSPGPWIAHKDELGNFTGKIYPEHCELKGQPALHNEPIADVYRDEDIVLVEVTTDLLKACEAALAYDQEIRRAASLGKSWVSGNRLDELYDDWIEKSRKAVEKVRGEK